MTTLQFSFVKSALNTIILGFFLCLTTSVLYASEPYEVLLKFNQEWSFLPIPSSVDFEFDKDHLLPLDQWEISRAPFSQRVEYKPESDARSGRQKTPKTGTKWTLTVPKDKTPKTYEQDITTLFSNEFTIENPQDYLRLQLEVKFVGAFIVYLNDKEVLRHGLDFYADNRTVANTFPLPKYQKFYNRYLNQLHFPDLDPGFLISGTNIIRVEVHRKVAKTNHLCMGFDLKLVGFKSRDFIKTPYLQNATNNQITIFWETPFVSQGIVEYGLTELNMTGTSPRIASSFHEVTLTDLRPDQQYFYRVRSVHIPFPNQKQLFGPTQGAHYSDISTFHTAPESVRPITFIAYGDNRTRPKSHKKLIKEMEGKSAEFIINTGDLTSHGTDYHEWQTQYFNPTQSITRSVPVYPVSGNHDGNHLFMYSYFDLPENESWYHFTYGPVEFFGVNTDTEFARKSTQYKWLEEGLKTSTASFQVVFYHYPAFSCVKSRQPGNKKVRKHLLPLMEKYQVDLVINGHDHTYSRTKPTNGVVHIITGGGGAPLYKTRTRKPSLFCIKKHHYLLFHADSKVLTGRAIDTDGEEFDSFQIKKKNKPALQE